MMLIVNFFFLFIISSKADENLLRGKPVNVTDYPDYAKNIADGDKDSCMWLRVSTINFIVFDLGKVHQIDKVSMYNRRFRGVAPFSVYLGNEFRPCHFPSQLKKYKLCKGGLVQNSEQMEFTCEDTGNQGRFLAVVKGRFFSTKKLDDLNFCELEAYGKPLYDTEEQQRPVLVNKPLRSVSRKDFPLVDILRKDVPVAEVWTYGRSFVKINKLCQPIIWDKAYNLTFALACETTNRKGRVAFFGKSWYFWYLKENEHLRRMQSNYYKWLSPNLNITTPVYSNTLKSVTDVMALREGEVIDYSDEAHSQGVIDAILKQLFDGKISLIVASSFNNADNLEIKNQEAKILDFFNLAISKTYFTFSESGEYTIKDEDFTEELFDFEERLERYLDNNDGLMASLGSLTKVLETKSRRLFRRANLGRIVYKYSERYEELLYDKCPCQYAPAVDTNDKALLLLLTQLFEEQSLAHSNFKLPCLDLFPGDFETCPKRSVVTLEIYGEIKNTQNPTGFYLEAGTTLIYEIENSTGNWSMSIGCQTETLASSQQKWTRYPNMFIDSVDIADKGTVYSPYGGPVWITNNIHNTTIRIVLYNVVATPFFNGRDKDAIEDWDKRQRHNPGLWAQVAGEDMVLCPRSEWIRDFSGELMEKISRSWDKVVRGFYALNSEDWRVQRPQQTVFDILNSARDPISESITWVTGTFNESYKTLWSSKGMCKELGLQGKDKRWTFSFTYQTTNEIFCFLSYPKIWNLPAYGVSLESLENDVQEIKTFLDGGASYQGLVDSKVIQLTMYSHLNNNLGLGFYHEVFAFYRNHQEMQPKTDPEKIDMWINITSRITEMNLVPFYEFWGLPIGNGVINDLSGLQCFIPGDHLTGLSVSRTKTIVDKYPNCLRKSKYFKDFDLEKYIQGHRPNFIKVIPD